MTNDDQSVAIFAFPLQTGTPVGAAPELTGAEVAVLQLIVDGKSNKEIALERRTSLRTVANQVANIFKKIGVSSRRELVVSYTRWIAGSSDERE
jgi:DNA-binding NarL/FixJ family response regulator